MQTAKPTFKVCGRSARHQSLTGLPPHRPAQFRRVDRQLVCLAEIGRQTYI
jgi:hypothetical protein